MAKSCRVAYKLGSHINRCFYNWISLHNHILLNFSWLILFLFLSLSYTHTPPDTNGLWSISLVMQRETRMGGLVGGAKCWHPQIQRSKTQKWWQCGGQGAEILREFLQGFRKYLYIHNDVSVLSAFFLYLCWALWHI